jgi:hypothetical protein
MFLNDFLCRREIHTALKPALNAKYTLTGFFIRNNLFL